MNKGSSRLSVVKGGRNGMSLIALCALFLSLSLLSGCVSGNVEVDNARRNLAYGDGKYAALWSDDLARSSLSKRLGALESGRVQMLQGRYEESAKRFGGLVELLFEESETGPVYKGSTMAGNVLAATVADDRIVPYEVPSYELIQALLYQSYNALFLGKPEDARVYARRATAVQEQLAEQYGAPTDAQERSLSPEAISAAQKTTAEIEGKLAPVADLVRATYENAVAWFLMGIFYEREGDVDNARIAYQNALQLMPGHPVFQQSLAGLNAPLKGQGEVILLYEEGFVSQRVPVKVPLYLAGTVFSLDFPCYNDPIYPAMQLSLKARGEESFCVPAVWLQSLAYRDLKEKIPGIVLRNVGRVATKVVAQQVARHSDNSDLELAILLVNTLSTVFTRADTRAWYTIPQVVHVARMRVPAGKSNLSVVNRLNGRQVELPVSVNAGESRLVWMADLGGRIQGAMASFGKGGQPPMQFSGKTLLTYDPTYTQNSGWSR